MWNCIGLHVSEKTDETLKNCQMECFFFPEPLLQSACTKKKPDLVFPVVLLTESEDPVAESEHVLEGTVPWIREFLDFQQGPLPTSSSTRG